MKWANTLCACCLGDPCMGRVQFPVLGRWCVLEGERGGGARVEEEEELGVVGAEGRHMDAVDGERGGRERAYEGRSVRK